MSLRILQVYLCLSLLFVEEASSSKCTLPHDGKSGSNDKIGLKIYDCVRATSSSKSACGGKEKKTVVLEKGKEVDIGYDVNDYAVMAKFFGDEICVSYYYIGITKGVGARTDKQCKTKCFNEEEEETYHYDVFCSYQSCGGGKKRLKFVITDSAAISTMVVWYNILSVVSVFIILV